MAPFSFLLTNFHLCYDGIDQDNHNVRETYLGRPLIRLSSSKRRGATKTGLRGEREALTACWLMRRVTHPRWRRGILGSID